MQNLKKVFRSSITLFSLPVFCLQFIGCATTHRLYPEEIWNAKTVDKSMIVRLDGKTWILDSARVDGRKITGKIHTLTTPAGLPDRFGYSSSSTSMNQTTPVIGQITIYPKRGVEFAVDSIPRAISFATEDMDSVSL